MVAIAADVAGFLAEVVAPNAVAMARGAGPSPAAVIRLAGAHGLSGLLIPSEYGGGGATHVEFAGVIEAVARVCASTSVILDVHLSVAAEPLMLFGSDDQRRRYLPKLARGEWLGAFALTEASSGSDAAALVSRASRRGDTYALTGSKAFITNAGAAGLYIVMARSGSGSRGISAFLVESGFAGVKTGEPLTKMGLRGSLTAELILDGVEVSTANRLGDEGAGFTIAMAALDSGRIGISAQAVGIAQGCLDAIVAQARRGGAVDETTIADLCARLQAARRLCLDAAATLDAGRSVTRLASVAKLYATDMCVAAAHAAVELCGPESAADDHPAAIRFRDAKACQIYEGTNQIQRLVISRQLLQA